MSEQYFFPDTTVLINFAVVDRLDLLLTYMSGRGRMTQAVRAEVRASAQHVPHLAQLNAEVEFGPSLETRGSEIPAVHLMRRRFASRDDRPLAHLGESETLVIMSSRPEFVLSRFVTEDRDAFRVAGALDVLRHNTCGVLRELVARGELALEEAFALVDEISLSPDDRVLLERPQRPADLLL